MDRYFDGLNQKLLDAIPIDACKVLELGCANGRLGRRFKELHPGVHWVGVELQPDAATVATTYLDHVITHDLNQPQGLDLGHGYDVIVIGDLLEHLIAPESVLADLWERSLNGAKLIICLPNMGHLSVISRLVAGDISYDDMGLLDRTHSRFYTPSSAFKALLDAGWLPHMQDQYGVEPAKDKFTEAIIEAAAALGVPRKTAQANFGLYQMILVCERESLGSMATPAPAQPFSVIVPVNREWQYSLNIARSLGLKEVNAQVIPVHGARSAAEAYALGAARAIHSWRVLAHQDVYFPAGSGIALARRLNELSLAGADILPVGFAGLERLPDGRVRKAGKVVDRRSLFSHGPSNGGSSLDEFAVALHANCLASIDPALGWHLWATDLCLQIERQAGRPLGQILDVALFHNSVNAFELPEAFHISAALMLRKYPERRSIETLCGEIQRAGYSTKKSKQADEPIHAA